MNFFDIDPRALPPGAQYYFNVLVIVVGFPSFVWEQMVKSADLRLLWDLQGITGPEPQAVCFYLDERLDQIAIELHPHKVVEVVNGEVGWYHMIDFDTEDLWNFDVLIIEEEEEDTDEVN